MTRLDKALFVMIILAAALPLAAQQDDRYLIRLDPAAAIDRVDAIAAQLATTHGGTIVSTESPTDDTIVLRIPATRAAALQSDPRVRAVRPLKVAAEAKVVEPVDWTTGVNYSYDGASSVTKIGRDEFAYDDVGRVVRAKVNDGTRTYEYDAFGNRKKCMSGTTDCQYALQINSSNNRLVERTDVDHDDAGNVIELGSHTYQYDIVNMMTKDHSTAGRYEYLYNAADERLATYHVDSDTWTWTLRDHDGKVVRELTSDASNRWTWTRDYVHRDGQLLASRFAADGFVDTHHYHLDHLGTPRRVTDSTDLIIGYHDYHAFGPEVPGSLQERGAGDRKYTGHEREPFTDEHTTDYMVARFYNPTLGRFLSWDPAMESINAARPQTWNRYAYVLNDPLSAIDPNGETLRSVTGQNTIRAIAGTAVAGKLSFAPDGTVDTTQFTDQDIAGNEGALLLRQMSFSQQVYTYEEGTSSPSRGGSQTVDGVLNLDDNPTDLILPNGNPHVKGPGRFPVAGVNGAVTVNPAARYVDLATKSLVVPTHAIAFHELAEAYAKVELNILRGPNNGPGAHQISRMRESILRIQRPNWTPYPAGGDLTR